MSTVAVTACELYSNPEKYDGQYVEVSGEIIVEFEHQALICQNSESLEKSQLSDIWLHIDLASIQKLSPNYFQQIKDGCDLAHNWKGGLRGNMRFRGHFTLPDSAKSAQITEQERNVFPGAGHMGMFGAEIVVEEVLDFQPQEAQTTAQETH